MTEAKFIIYALVDPRSKEWRYIGYSSCGMRRPRKHATAAVLKHESHKTHWIRTLHAAGLSYEIEVIETLSEREQLPEAEREWIAEARRVGVNLTNHTDGGDGVLNPPAEVRAKMRAAKLGRRLSEETLNKMRARKPTEETREKMRASATGKKHSAETLEKMRQAQKGRGKGRKLPEDQRRKVIAVLKSLPPASEETRAKISAALKGRVFSDEHRRKIGEASRNRSEATRAKMSRSAKIRCARRWGNKV